MKTIRLTGSRGKVSIEALVEQVPIVGEDPLPLLVRHETAQVALENSTVVLRRCKLSGITPPHPLYKSHFDYPMTSDIEFIFNGAGIDQGDLVSDLAHALSQRALIHTCQRFDAPATCGVCGLLARVKQLQNQTFTVPESRKG